MNDKNRLYAGAALGLVAAAALGFGAARLTQPSASAPAAETESQASAAPTDTIAISQQGIAASQIGIAPAASGELDAAIPAAATVEATPDAEAVLTARAPGTVTRIFKRIGDPVGQGETLALVESRDASTIAADQAAAAARVTLANRQLARERGLLAQGVSPRADYEAAEANLAVAQADARRASAAAGAARVSRDGRSVAVVSPVSGRITSAPANLGQFVAAETELFRVADPRRLQITASIPPADAGRVRTGDRVELTVSDGRTIEGRVRSATGVIDPQSRAATVVIEPKGDAGLLAPGQLVQARIFASGGAVKDGVMVPQDAVQTIGDRTVVFVRTRDGFKAQTVQAGSRSGGLVAIVSGLKAGTPIATTNAFLLKAELEKESAE
ncbi:efflux RND transporter periplasmic adaptor subunit [Sphingomonas koreensis]|jgi:cobalt-zinc-cadmium efflux system membrane fusion protein|uniref:Efflux RND transporter periplasmic adaptor subunit n=4 Tax=Sphingomonadales TaxID=204457 RepID=A0A1L6J7Y6_9SPHN|nr:MULTISPECIES: efflux RND transporter periplasmic adaptor subunit [Pseudomonadota]MAF62148.1 efflux RND transporter periplasmic adaptor subunit [Blastomonas sp.]OJY69976.1 MAG: efflux transporter periplasmic adaptor subunit [Sphingobium sp. 66-54]OYX47223.1 MAG: efflux transporter periplasmic adaptor subunit [Sphingomonadales bacterium 32-64-22]QEH77878.1 efflux RND transporter periplasmic adaptor subunit [Sphingomonas sp. C8-2]APR52081.1 efflux transporter periplasmic adaptor subunit [Sphin|tara:strand:+ start:10503 stop:11660 length:1158 start_codon:yes stop_codon:yes gene_type:complete